MPKPPATEPPEPGFCVVGLGASAGGLEALTEFFAALRHDSSHAFVVVSHLDPEHKSALAEILAKVTRMPVTPVRDGMRVAPDRVYVIPPNAKMGINDGTLTLAPRPAGRAPPMPINALYKTSDLRIDGAVITLLEIDLMKRREEALRIAEERFRMLVEGVQDYAIVSLDAEGRVANWNRGAERLTGYREDEIVGQSLARLFTAEDIAANKPRAELELAGREGRSESEGWRVRKDGTRFWGNSLLTALRGADGVVHGFAKITRDITAPKQMEKEVAEAAAQEQQRIGQELHDSVGQELTALGLLAESMVESLTERADPDAKLAAKITGGVRRVLGQVRAITQGLIPVEVDGAGLMAALTDLAAKISEHPSVTCTFTCAQPVAIDDNQTATQLFRIAQEAVTNALKHGRPHHIRIGLAENDEQIVMEVADDGTGLSGAATTGGGMGLKIMRYRAGLISGTLTIASTPEHGTVVACTLTKGHRHEPKQTSRRQPDRAGPDR